MSQGVPPVVFAFDPLTSNHPGALAMMRGG